MRFMLELQKLLMKYSNKGVHLLLGSFPLFITCSSLHGNYGWRFGGSSIRDMSSIRHVTVYWYLMELALIMWNDCCHTGEYMVNKVVINLQDNVILTFWGRIVTWFKFSDVGNVSIITLQIKVEELCRKITLTMPGHHCLKLDLDHIG